MTAGKQKKLSSRFAIPAGVGLMLAVASGVALVLLVVHFNFTQDDAYITFRYAANFAAGHGLVYNVGERVEGYTNFLWTIVMTLGRRGGLDLVLFSKILGTLFALATLAILFLLARRLFRDTPPPWPELLPGLVCLVTGLTWSFAYWTVAGLETAAFTFTVTASLYCYLRRLPMLAVTLVTATLFRPEGGLVCLFILAYDLVTSRRLTRYTLTVAVLYLLFLAPLAVFKLSYYGGLLPNPFYAKTSFSGQQLLNGLDYAGQYFYHYWGAGLLLIPVVYTFRQAAAPVKMIILFTLTYTLYIVLVGGDVLKVHRFFVPIIPALVLVALAALRLVFAKRWMVAVSLAALLAWQGIIPYKHVTTFHFREKGFGLKLSKIMDHLLAVDQSNFSLAITTIGLVGYRLMGHTVIDMLGLTDSTIARHPEPPVEGMQTTWREAQFNSRYVLTRQPDYIMFSTGFKPSAPAERALYLYSSFMRAYRSIGFYFSGNIHPLYKRYFPVTGEIVRDVDSRFVQFFNLSINQLWDVKNYAAALAYSDSALAYSPTPPFPYIYYYRSIIFSRLNNKEGVLKSLFRTIELDTLVYEGYLNLASIYYQLGDYGNARICRDKTLRLAPWYKSHFDTALVKLR